jgi:CRISPR/Cas system endoribonuclease Cas6 (RAMP superfamily)
VVSPLIDPEIKHSAGVAFHIRWPLAERLHVWISFEQYPSVLRFTRKQRQSPSKFRAEDLDTPLPRPPLYFYRLSVFRRHGA